MNFKLPDAEKISYDLLQKTDQIEAPVDLTKIASLWSGLEISYDDLKDEGYLLDVGIWGKEIVIRSSTPLPIQRFTIAHEIGHLILRENKIKLDETIVLHSKAAKNSFIERWCDSFASSLLIPKEWILRDIRQYKIRGLVEGVLNLPSVYQVSPSAFRMRISGITPLSIFDIKQTNKRLISERVIDKSFESSSVRQFYLKKTLEELIPNLEMSAEPVKYVNSDTKMLAVYGLVSKDSDIHKWTVCIFPQAVSPKSYKPR
jgi:hypothetical protein